MFFRPAESFQATADLLLRDSLKIAENQKIKLKAAEGAKVLQPKSSRLERIVTLFTDHTIKSINSFP